MIGLCAVYGAEQKRRVLSRASDQEKVPVRSEPNINAKIIKELFDGIVVDEIDRTSEEDTVGEVTNYWYKIALPDGTQGWVFGINVSFSPLDPEYKSNFYKKLYKRLRLPEVPNLARDQRSFLDYVYYFNLLTGLIPEVKDPETAAKLKLGRLMCLQRSLALGVWIEPPDFDELDIKYLKEKGIYVGADFNEWIKENEDYIRYDEFSEQWILKYEVLWSLHEEYRNLPVADDIAWEAANNPLGGECENEFLCYIRVFNATIVRYLRLHPEGMYVPLALESLISFFEDCRGEEPPDYFGDSFGGDAKAELELMREALKLVLEAKDKRPERALNQFEKTFEIYFKKDK
jgi:hypothetical protein